MVLLPPHIRPLHRTLPVTLPPNERHALQSRSSARLDHVDSPRLRRHPSHLPQGSSVPRLRRQDRAQVQHHFVTRHPAPAQQRAPTATHRRPARAQGKRHALARGPHVPGTTYERVVDCHRELDASTAAAVVGWGHCFVYSWYPPLSHSARAHGLDRRAPGT
jgi:hypothetical protein